MRRKTVLAVCLLVVIPLVLYFVSTKHSVSASLNFVTKWGYYEAYSGGSANGRFTEPYGVAIDTDTNDTYVLDSGNNRVEEFDGSGAYVRQWGGKGSGNGEFDGPQGIAIATSSGRIYVTDPGNYRVEEFDLSGNYISQWGSQGNGNGQFQDPVGVAADSSGNVYVVDISLSNVQEFLFTGGSWTWESDVPATNYPEGLAMDGSDNVYVSGYTGIQEFDNTGSEIASWPAYNSGNPRWVAVDSSGNVFTSDISDDLVVKYASGGAYLTSWGGEGTDTGQFSQPEGLAIDSSGNVFVADSDGDNGSTFGPNNNRVQEFDNSGNYLSELGYFLPADGAFDTPQGIAVDSAGNVYVADTQNDRIEEFDNSGNYLAQWGTPGTGSGQFSEPYTLAIGPSPGNIYVLDSGNDRIEEFDSGGTFIRTWGSYGTGNSQFKMPSGIAVDSSGDVYVADSGNNRIQKFDSNGNFLFQWGSSGGYAGQFSFPVGIAVDYAGNVYVADSYNNRIQRFNSSGTYINQWGGINGSNVGQFNGITGIAVDLAGNVFVADSNNERIQEFTSSGAFVLSGGGWFTPGFGSGNGEFEAPTGIAFDPSGDLFVADTGNNRIQKFTISLDPGPYSSNAEQGFYRGDDTVESLIEVGNTLYLGGTFGLEAVDLTTGQQIPWSPGLPGGTGNVFSLAYSAANNILYVGSDNGLLEYDTSAGTGTLVSSFTPAFADTNGNYDEDDEAYGSCPAVYALTIVDNTLYVGGCFTSIDTNPRVNLAAFDISTPGAVLKSWEHDTDSTGTSNQTSVVYAFATSSAMLYAGGTFLTVDGSSQSAVAAFDLSSGDPDGSFVSPFDNNSSVNALAYYNNKVYAGGTFTVTGAPEEYDNGDNLVSLDAATGAADLDWKYTFWSQPVNALAVRNNYLYVGAGIWHSEIGFAMAWNMDNGNQIDWYPEDNESVLALLATDRALYAGLYDVLLPVQIGGLTGATYVAKFDALSAVTPTPAPTSSPTPTPAPAQPPSGGGGGGSAPAPVCSDQKPGLVQNLELTAGPGIGQVTLSWQPPAGPVSDYSITYSNEAGVQLWGVVSTHDQTTYTISNLPMNSNYYFWVNAVNGCMPGDAVEPEIHLGNTPTSSYTVSTGYSSASVTIPPPSPLPPTGPGDMIKVGVTGVILTIIGGALLLAL